MNAMTLEEAKEFYFRYLGSLFHMDREEPAAYGSFKMLGLGKDTLREWDEELLDGLFQKLWSEPDRVWAAHERIVRIIARNNCDTQKNVGRLLDEMEKMEDLDEFNATLIIENMAGRTDPMNDGGVYAVCAYSGLAARMDDIMERLIAACSAHHEADARFDEAVRRYRSAWCRWGVPGMRG